MAKGNYAAKRGRPPKGSKQAPQSLPTAVCTQCGKRKPVSQFYGNRLWKDNNAIDSWCKECVQLYARDKTTLLYYLEQNNRIFVDSLWESCLATAVEEPLFSTEMEPEVREDLLDRGAITLYFKQMNLRAFYGFQRNVLPEQLAAGIHNAQGGGYAVGDDIAEKSYHTQMTYSPKWGGHFSQASLDRLEALYTDLEESYPLDTVDDRVSAREYARITIQAEQAFQQFQGGDPEALKQYNILLDRRQKISNDSQFTKKARPKDVVSEDDLLVGILTKRLESEGLLLRPTRVFPPDELDALHEEIRHLASCLGDGGST